MLGLTAVVPEIDSSEDVGGAIRALANERVDVVIVLESGMLLSLRRQIAQLMAEKGLPAVYGYRLDVDEGGLSAKALISAGAGAVLSHTYTRFSTTHRQPTCRWSSRRGCNWSSI